MAAYCTAVANPESRDRKEHSEHRGGDIGVKRVAPLESDQEMLIIRGQQGEKRHRDKNAVPTPRQFVTHVTGSLPIAGFAVQHEAGNRWLWHRIKKSNGSATVRTEIGATRRPA